LNEPLRGDLYRCRPAIGSLPEEEEEEEDVREPGNKGLKKSVSSDGKRGLKTDILQLKK
jgi:hypothetical protein